MKLELAIKEYLKEIEVRKYTPKTIRSYRNNLSLFLRFCEEKVDIENTEGCERERIVFMGLQIAAHMLPERWE